MKEPSGRGRIALIGALTATVVGALFLPSAFAAEAVPAYLTDQLAACQANQRVATTLDEKAWADHCVTLAQRAIEAWAAANPEPTPSATPVRTTTQPQVTPSATPPVETTTPPSPSPSPTPTPTPSGWPDATNTGVPAGVALTAYTGPCTITVTGMVIDAKAITCAPLTITAGGVHITRSRINGRIQVDGGLVIADSTIVTAPNTSGLDGANFTATRVDISGGNRGAYCVSSCVIRDSYFHGQRISSGAHASAVRMEQNGTLEHNTLLCDPVVGAGGGACSADLTMYPDFAPVHHVTVQGNHFLSPPGSYYCAYGGGTAGKPYSGDPTNATYIAFLGNTWDGYPTCGGLAGGGPISGWLGTRTGNVWSGNVWSDGAALTL